MKDQELMFLRLAIIGRIVAGCNDIGKTKLQKIAYFLQQAVGVPLKYPFRIHYFGPYSDELDGMLSLAKALGTVDINPDLDGFGYHVTPGSNDESAWSEAYDLSKHPKIAAIDNAVKVLGSLETSELELLATIHFISGTEVGQSKAEVFKTVREIKPKFSRGKIDGAYQTLKQARLI